MRAIETDWWIMDLPDEWEAEQDEETIVIGDEDGVGVLELTTLEQEPGGLDDLAALAASFAPDAGKGQPVRLAECDGLYFDYVDEDDAVREWLLAGDGVVLLVTYSCALEHRGIDAAMIDEILETLVLKPRD